MAWRNGPSRTSTTTHRTWRRLVLERDGWTCRIAGPRCTISATEADHITPVSEGGRQHDVANGQAACATCHAAKTREEAARGRARWQQTRPRARRPPETHPGLKP